METDTTRENHWTCFFVGVVVCIILYAIGHFLIG